MLTNADPPPADAPKAPSTGSSAVPPRRAGAVLLDSLKGKAGLAPTFWILGVAAWSLVTFGAVVLFDHLLFSTSIHFGVKAGIVVVYFGFTYLVQTAILKSAKHYGGRKIWAVLAKAYAIVMVAVPAYPFALQVLPLSINPRTASIINGLRPTAQMPLVGFWKVHMYLTHGVAIADAGDGMYSLSFCGPGGCFRPGEWSPNSTIVGDPSYRVIDENTIEFLYKCSEPDRYRRSTKGLPVEPPGPASRR